MIVAAPTGRGDTCHVRDVKSDAKYVEIYVTCFIISGNIKWPGVVLFFLVALLLLSGSLVPLTQSPPMYQRPVYSRPPCGGPVGGVHLN